jgi:hypothetical protein
MRHVKFIGGPADGSFDDFQSDKVVGDRINVRSPEQIVTNTTRQGLTAVSRFPTGSTIYEVTRPGVAEPV